MLSSHILFVALRLTCLAAIMYALVTTVRAETYIAGSEALTRAGYPLRHFTGSGN